jgi:hypothetical protein
MKNNKKHDKGATTTSQPWYTKKKSVIKNLQVSSVRRLHASLSGPEVPATSPETHPSRIATRDGTFNASLPRHATTVGNLSRLSIRYD